MFYQHKIRFQNSTMDWAKVYPYCQILENNRVVTQRVSWKCFSKLADFSGHEWGAFLEHFPSLISWVLSQEKVYFLYFQIKLGVLSKFIIFYIKIKKINSLQSFCTLSRYQTGLESRSAHQFWWYLSLFICKCFG